MTVAATAISRRSGISFGEFYQELVDRGYVVEKIYAAGFDSTGYYEILDKDQEVPEDAIVSDNPDFKNKVWREWKDRSDWEFVDANYPGVGGWTYE